MRWPPSSARPGTAASSSLVYSCAGAAEDPRGGTLLDDPAAAHDGDVVRDLARTTAEVVRDEHVADAELALQLGQQVAGPGPAPRRRAPRPARRATISSGSIASARAIATRWRWPPESSAGRRAAASVGSADEVEQLGRRARAGVRRVPTPSDDAAARRRLRPTANRGSSDANGFWLHDLELGAAAVAQRAPAERARCRRRRTTTRPASAPRARARAAAVVVLPEPDSPTIARVGRRAPEGSRRRPRAASRMPRPRAARSP